MQFINFFGLLQKLSWCIIYYDNIIETIGSARRNWHHGMWFLCDFPALFAANFDIFRLFLCRVFVSFCRCFAIVSLNAFSFTLFTCDSRITSDLPQNYFFIINRRKFIHSLIISSCLWIWDCSH